MKSRFYAILVGQCMATTVTSLCWSQSAPGCAELPDHSKLRTALTATVKEGENSNGGLGNQMWAVVVNRDGIVCAVAFSGPGRGAQWPGSRIIAAEKANTANAFSGPNFALSTANVCAGSQPGGSLYGIVTSAPRQTRSLRYAQ